MIILDANVAVNIVRGTELGHALRSLILQGEPIVAPYLFVSEVANSLWKYVRAGQMGVQEAAAKAQEAYGLVDEFAPDTQLMPEALYEAAACGHSAYDMLYLVLARRRCATLLTADAKLLSLCETAGVDCVLPISFEE